MRLQSDRRHCGGYVRASAGRRSRLSCDRPSLALTAVVAEGALRHLAEVDLGEPQHLPLVDVVDVDSHVSHQLRRDSRVVLLDVRHPVVGCVGPAVPVTEEEDRARGRERLGDVLPVLGTVVLIDSLWVAGVVAHLVEASTRSGATTRVGRSPGLAPVA